MQLGLHDLGGCVSCEVWHEQHAAALEPGSNRIGDDAIRHSLDGQLPGPQQSPVEWMDVGPCGEL